MVELDMDSLDPDTRAALESVLRGEKPNKPTDEDENCGYTVIPEFT